MVIRTAQEADLPQLLEIYDRLYDMLTGEYGYPFEFSREQNERTLAVQIKSKLCRVLVAQEEQELCGFAHGSISRLDRRVTYKGAKTIGRVDDIYVEPEKRGGGLAAQLMAGLEEWFRQEEVQVVESYILSKNGQSLAFHEKCGFEPASYRVLKDLS